jgi:acetyl-CoA synthetase
MSDAIESLLAEGRTFPPSAGFKKTARVTDAEVYDEANADVEGFWARQAADLLDWYEEWDTVLEWDLPFAKWFVGGKLNASYNCLDRHVAAGHGGKVAYHWEGEPGDTRTITYAQLLDDVSRLANALKELGVRKGDRVNVYLGMVPELPMALLACARIGAAHSVVFGGFSSDSLRDRINDAEAKVLITADGAWRRGNAFPLKETADEAIADCPSIEKVLVLRRTESDVPWTEGRDVWWHDLVPGQSTDCPPEPMDSEDLLYLLYTSGTTAKPKGIMHTTGGYLTQVAYTHRTVFDLDSEHDVYWCAADVGWVTGHSYIVYGPLMNLTTSVMYEGTPDYPDKDRLWQIVAKYGVTILYTAPTAIRTFMKWGAELPDRHDLSSLRLLGTVGEPINPEAWVWYWKVIGGGRCPVVDTWWQTETGHILITPLPGVTTLKPGSATKPFPGIDAAVLDEQGKPAKAGYLVLRKPWPGMLRGIWGDPERFVKQYWVKYKDLYFTGDGAKVDRDGYFWLLGRVDDVMNISGHRVSTMEVESALVDHKSVAEAAVIGKPHEIKGQAIAAFVTVKTGVNGTFGLMDELKAHVARKIGALARPDDIIFSAELPKTRSGKIMRRLLRDIAEGRALGDTTTLADPAVVASLKKKYEDQET